MGFLVLVVIAAISGSIGARIAGQRSDGCLMSIALGFIGGLIGQWIAGRLDVAQGPTFRGLPVLWAIIGAALFVAVINLIGGDRRR